MRITLALKAVEAGEQFNVRHAPVHGKPRGIVSRVAEAAQVSKQTVYAHRDLLPAGSCRTENEIASAIAQALENPPAAESRHGQRGGSTKQLPARIAEVTGVCRSTVQRHLAQQSNGNGNGAHRETSSHRRQKKPEPVEWSDEDRTLARIVHLLETISGTDVRHEHLLRRAGEQLSRINREFTGREVEVAL